MLLTLKKVIRKPVDERWSRRGGGSKLTMSTNHDTASSTNLEHASLASEASTWLSFRRLPFYKPEISRSCCHSASAATVRGSLLCLSLSPGSLESERLRLAGCLVWHSFVSECSLSLLLLTSSRDHFRTFKAETRHKFKFLKFSVLWGKETHPFEFDSSCKKSRAALRPYNF